MHIKIFNFNDIYSCQLPERLALIVEPFPTEKPAPIVEPSSTEIITTAELIFYFSILAFTGHLIFACRRRLSFIF
jgi:hypothetical protein